MGSPTDTTHSTVGLAFTERMAGYVARRGDPEGAPQHPLEFLATITAQDLDHFLKDEAHLADLSGTITSPLLGGTVPIRSGAFQLFVADPDNVNTRRFNYTIHFADLDNHPYVLRGCKTVRDDQHGLDAWADTTTLAVELYDEATLNGPPTASGTLHLSPGDFLRELGTVKILRAPNEAARLQGIARFARFFAHQMFETYGGIFLKDNLFNPDAPPRTKRALHCGTPEQHWVATADGLKLRLSRYRGGDKGPVLLVHGLGVSSMIFSIDTIDPNLVEYLYARGYDVWLLDYRASIDLPYAAGPYTADDVALKDYPVALEAILQLTRTRSLQCVVHCYGANTFFMAMLAGLKGVRSAVVSQIATHLRVPHLTQIKALFHTPDILKMFGVADMNAYVDAHATWRDRLADHLLRFYPVHDGPRDTNPVSRRISFIYGQLYELNQLNQSTYDNLHELFGLAGIDSLQQLALMIRAEKILRADGTDGYLQENLGFPTLGRLAIPMLFIHGEKNQCWLPESTALTYELLRSRNDPALYTRQLIPGYGHIDCIFGKNAATDVFRYAVAHLDKTATADH
jgi:cholesterol oxidase